MIMRNISLLILIFLTATCKTPSNSSGPARDSAITATEVERIERILAADDMRGRRTFSPEIDRAADFISEEFKSAGLKTLNNLSGYRQEFSLMKARLVSVRGNFDGKDLGA